MVTMTIEAGPIHLQHISVTLKLLEQALIEIERAVREPPPAASLTTFCDQIEPTTGLNILGLVSDAQRHIETIAAVPKRQGILNGRILRAVPGAASDRHKTSYRRLALRAAFLLQ